MIDPMLGPLFKEQKAHITHFFDQIDQARAEEIFELIANCQGTIYFTGVGKNSFIAEKLAMTFVSIGIKSFPISASGILHGDIGIVTSDDIVIFLSKSGQTDELLTLIPHIKKRQARTIAWVSNPEAPLANTCDHSIFLPLQKELCPFGLAPTTSSSLQLIFGDILAAALMRKTNLTLDDYALNHPAGAIGKRISLTVADLMISGGELPLCSMGTPLQEALIELSNKRCGCVIVMDNHKPVGLFTDGDFRRTLQKHGSLALKESIDRYMTTVFKSIPSKSLAYDALKEMEGAITALPVIDDGALKGLIHIHDLLKSGLALSK